VNIAQAFFEVFKALPKKTQKEMKQLIEEQEIIGITTSPLKVRPGRNQKSKERKSKVGNG